MKIFVGTVISITLLVLTTTSCSSKPKKTLNELFQAHAGANVPENDEKFKELLNASLLEYFSKELKDSQFAIKFELLRKNATQTGVSYPKYYSWVDVHDINKKIITSGAVRLAAINKEIIKVTHFLSATDIKADEAATYKVFPKSLCENIIERSKK